MTAAIARRLPGLGLLVVGAVCTRLVAQRVPVGSELILAVVLGLVVGNTVGVPAWGVPGVETNPRLLEAGIILMGATVAVGRIVEAGPTVAAVVLLAVLATISMVELVARVADIPAKVGSLLAAGSGICGVSAVAAVAGSIRPDDRQVAYAAATILLFDAVTLFVYPLVGDALALSDIVFGVWAGTTMFSTGPVTAAGFAYSETAGQWAVLVKLARNTLIGVVAVGYAVLYSRHSEAASADGSGGGVRENLRHLWTSFPTFVVGFLFVMALASAGFLSDAQVALLETTSDWLFLVAFVGLGTAIDVSEFRETGVRPVLVVLVTLLTVSSVMLGVSVVVF
ncbi:YeiH family protein [Halomarina rubra]|uniref:YeiH family protein n=1 Tax=Halomarina rubra TaxID=2071873 RepID=A0ABD6AY55_9EURY|nr:putative sulfate exporter family transporter [Halomarina rubra]